MILIKVISGGQTGVDQAGIAAAFEAGIPTGGWAPKGWKTKDGSRPILLGECYGLKEHSGGYKERTWANVRDSDGTMRLATNFNSPGERCTWNAINHYNKPWLDIDLDDPLPVSEAVAWIIKNNIKVLNIAGNAETATNNIFRRASIYLQVMFQKLEAKDGRVRGQKTATERQKKEA